MNKIVLTTAALLVAASLAAAQTKEPDHQAHHPAGAASAPAVKPPATAAIAGPTRPADMSARMSAMQDMHQKMMAAKQGDAAEMWTRKMIEHHRGAVAMSRVALRVANDAETKRMAQMGIAEQEKSIAELQGWLSKHGKRPQ